MTKLTSSLCTRNVSLSKLILPFKSKVEETIIRSKEPIKVNTMQQLIDNKEQSILMNRCEICNWNGDLPISDYPLNEDPCPEVIKKKSKKIDQKQKVSIRYLKPPPLPIPGPVIVKHEANKLTAPAPPIVIRQNPPRQCTPEYLVIREAPPPQPPRIPTKTITIPGKTLPAPPRKVIIERLAIAPQKPQTVIIERWLPYQQPKRKVIFQPAPPDPVVCKPKNFVVQWEPADVFVIKDVENLGVVNVDPCDYSQKFGDVLKSAKDFPIDLKNLPSQQDIKLAANQIFSPIHELEGDIEALKLIDLDSEGLGMYKHLVKNTSNTCLSPKHVLGENFGNFSNCKQFERSTSFTYQNDLIRSNIPSVLCITTCNSPISGEEFYKRYDFMETCSRELFY